MVGRAPKFLGALKVVPKLVASDRKIGRLWMLATLIELYNTISSTVLSAREGPSETQGFLCIPA